MNNGVAITVLRERDELARLWTNPEYESAASREVGAAVVFKEAPGDRGTEIHVDLGRAREGGGGLRARLTAAERRAKVKDALRRFKQLVETGEIPRSDGSPEGERAERKVRQRPARPLAESELAELEKAGVS
jgi:uncharacterized membrane protein